MAAIRKKLGELLMEAGLIDEMQLKAALSHQKEWGGRLGAVLIRKGFVRETDMISVIEHQMGMTCMPLERFVKPSDGAVHLVNEGIARKFGVLPQEFDGKSLVVLTSDPTDLKMLDDLAFLLNVRIRPRLALESDIITALDHFYDPMTSGSKLQRKSKNQDMSISPSESHYELMHHDYTSQTRDQDKIEPMRGNIEHDVLASIVDLLVERGIFTRDELAERVNFRKS